MNCLICGNPIEDGAKECPKCGAPVGAVPQYQEQHAPQPQGGMPLPPPNPGMSKTYTVKKGKGTGWITFAKVMLWLSFAGIIIMGIIMGITVMSVGSVSAIASPYGDIAMPAIGGAAAIIAGFFIIIISVVLAFVSVCYGFILLDACTNLVSMNDNLAELITITADSKNTSERINATVYEILRK